MHAPNLFIYTCAIYASLRSSARATMDHADHPLSVRDFSGHFRGIETCLAGETPGYVLTTKGAASQDVTSHFLRHKSPNGSVVLLSTDYLIGDANAKSLAYFIDTLANLNATLKEATQRRMWDAETCVAFLICTRVSDVVWLKPTLEFFWGANLLNFVVVYYYERVEVATFNPYGKEKFTTLGDGEYFPDKLRNLGGFRLNITTGVNPPLSGYNKEGRPFGLDINVLLTLLERMNATVNFTNTEVYPDTDFKFYSSVIYNVVYNSTNHLYPYRMDDVLILVPKTTLPHYQYIFRVFTATIWFLIFLSFTTIIVISIALSEGETPTPRNILRTLLASPGLFNRILPSVKSVFVLWAYLYLVLSTAFNSTLTSVLITPKYSKQVNTIEELTRTDLGIMSDPFFESVLQDQLGGIRGEVVIIKKMEVVKSLFRRETRFAHVLPVSLLAQLNILDEEGQQFYHVMHQRLMPSLRTYYIRGKSFFVRKMEEIFFDLLANGVVSYIESRKKKEESSAANKRLGRPEVFKLTHLSFAFISLIVGLVISFIAFIFERYLYRH